MAGILSIPLCCLAALFEFRDMILSEVMVDNCLCEWGRDERSIELGGLLRVEGIDHGSYSI